MWELLFVIFIGRKTKFEHVATLPKNRYTDSHHRSIQPVVQFQQLMHGEEYKNKISVE